MAGKITTQEIDSNIIDTDLSSVSSNNDTIPSAKATKTYADTKQPLNSNLTSFSSKTAPTGNVVGDSDTQTITNKIVSTGCKLDANTDANFTYNFMNRQSLINSNFDIWQRGISFTNPTSSSFTADHWKVNFNTDSGTLPSTIIHSQQSLNLGDIFNSYYFYRINPNGIGTSLGTNSYYTIQQCIEYGTRYLCGNGKKISLSFYARSNISNKKIGCYLAQNYGTGGSPSTQELLRGTYFTLSSTWTKFNFTFTTNTLVGKTFGTNNDDNLKVAFAVEYGSLFATNVGDSIAETFGGSGNIDIAQIQLNLGDVILPFNACTFDEELRKCLRYTLIPQTNSIWARMISYTSNTLVFFIPTPTVMRISPTILGTAGTDIVLYNTALSAQTGFSFNSALTYGGVIITATKTSHGLTDGCLEIKATSGLTSEI